MPAAAPASAYAPRVGALNGLSLAPLPRRPSAPSAHPDTAFGAPDDALIPGARPRGVVPDTMLPHIDPIITHAPPSMRTRFDARTIAIIAMALVITVAGIWSLLPSGSHANPQPTILAARPPFAGIPTSLSDVVRIAAESARHTALMTVIDTAGASAAPVTVTQLQAAQPSYQWVLGSVPSTTNTIVSITSGQGIDVIAVSGTDKDICAFGRWSPTVGTDYVTMAHVKVCSATNAPTTGWSALAGGDAQDLPGADGA